MNSTSFNCIFDTPFRVLHEADDVSFNLTHFPLKFFLSNKGDQSLFGSFTSLRPRFRQSYQKFFILLNQQLSRNKHNLVLKKLPTNFMKIIYTNKQLNHHLHTNPPIQIVECFVFVILLLD